MARLSSKQKRELIQEIENKYIKSEHKLSYTKLYEIYKDAGIGYNSIANAGKQYNWPERRREYWSRQELINTQKEVTKFKKGGVSVLNFVNDVIDKMYKKMKERDVTPSYSELHKYIDLRDKLMEKSKQKDEVIILGASKMPKEEEIYPPLYDGIEAIDIDNKSENAEVIKAENKSD
jgi:hypothetical protein